MVKTGLLDEHPRYIAKQTALSTSCLQQALATEHIEAAGICHLIPSYSPFPICERTHPEITTVLSPY